MISVLLLILIASFLNLFYYYRSGKKFKRSISVVVLGDISRSPRMMRHALSFANRDWSVSVFAYPSASKTPKTLVQHPKIKLVYLRQFPELDSLVLLPKVLFLMLVGPIKAIYLSLTLLHSIITKSNRSSYVMVQNPPAIPTLPIIQICRLVIGFNLIIDWHNTGYTILALKLNSDYHPMVRLARWIEATFGRDAYLHLFVTRAEKIHLSKVWDLRGEKKVFYDRPPAEFCRLSVERIHSFFCKSSFNSDPKLIETFNSEPPLLEETLITFREDEGGRIKFKPNRPVLLISTTSWTVDEDFHILIDALSIYVNRKRSVDKNLPKLLCFITGKGPLKSYYQKQIERRALKEDWRLVGVECHLVWLDDQEDYQRLLGSCDLGLSLHQSSSGLDLPMKVVDMFGCDLPVCAKNFDCLSELVKHDKNGLVFDRAEELASQIAELLKDFSLTEGGSKLNQLRLGIRSLRYGQEEEEREWTDWDSNWKVDVLDSLKL